MAKVSEQISKANATSQGRTDANLANDSNHLGGIAADEYATKKYVQDYHNTKESAQKEYIDQQDQAVLNQAKEYTNSQIRNQDFSSFAKVTDVQALDTKLSGELTDGLNAQKNYTDQKTQAIVSDVNANFQEVEGAIGTLNGTVNNLFGSVSNGKAQVAEAITDKGVATSANDSFSTMANNISQIKTGGSGVDPNYVNTSDADATANDITVGKSAYVKGQKIYGTLIAEPATGYPVIGTDTSNATATAEDIAYGKTAYARGQLLIGTATGSVEEIHGISSEDYVVDRIITAAGNPPDGAEKATEVSRYAFSQDGGYCVRLVRAGGVSYMESFAINSEGLYYQASKGATTGVTYKKYRYTLEELGIVNPNDGTAGTVTWMALGCPGFGGDNKKCVLAILFSAGGTQYIRLLTYHLSDNGIIGMAYDGERNYIDVTFPTEITNNHSYNRIVADLTNPLNFYCSLTYYSSGTRYFGLDKINVYQTVTDTNINYLITTYKGETISASYENDFCCLRLTEDNRYAVIYAYDSDTGRNQRAFIYDIYSSDTPKWVNTGRSFAGVTAFNNRVFCIEDNSTSSEIRINVYELKIGDDGNSWIDDSSVRKAKVPAMIDTAEAKCIYTSMCMATNDGKRLVCVAGGYLSTNANSRLGPYLLILDMEEILSLPTGASAYTEVTKLQEDGTNLQGTIDTQTFVISPMFKNKSSTLFYIMITSSYDPTYQILHSVANTEDEGNVIAVIYKNEYFTKVTPHALSAGGPDVRAGKTFIGWMGYPETGTMEVE